MTPVNTELAPQRVDAEAALERHFAAAAELHQIPTLLYGVTKNGEIVASGCVGEAAITPQAASRVCSMTKSFVAAAVLLLRDREQLHLDVPIALYVPELARLAGPTADSPPVTVRSLLTMSSGLPDDDAWADRLMDHDRRSVDELFAAGATFAHPPGTQYEYSNFGWVMLGRTVANVTGRRAQEFITTELLQPLGLSNTRWQPAPDPVLKGHRRRGDVVVAEDPPLADGDFAPMAGLWSTVDDVCRWIDFFLDSYPARDDPETLPLHRASRREMQQIQRVRPPSAGSPVLSGTGPAGYGFGLSVEHDTRFGHMVGHAGGLPGFGSFMAWLPERHVGVVALGNLTYAPLGPPVVGALDLLDDLGEVPPRSDGVNLGNIKTLADRLLDALARPRLVDDPSLFSDNVFLDLDQEERLRDAARLRENASMPFQVLDLEAESATRGRIRLAGCDRPLTISVLLTPEVPPRLQRYEIEFVEGA